MDNVEKSEEVSLSLEEVLAKKTLKGVELKDNQVRKSLELSFISKEASEDEEEEESSYESQLAKYHPSDEDLKKIKTTKLMKYSPKPEDLVVFELQAADSEVDRGFEQFQKEALGRLAELAIQNKIPVLLASPSDYGDHTWKACNVRGVVFDAYVKAGKLIYRAFFPKTETNRNVIEDIMNGLLTKLSVGFAVELKDYRCSSCKKPLFSMECPHYPGELDEKGKTVVVQIMDVSDNFEVSIVAVPMQRESEFKKSLEDPQKSHLGKINTGTSQKDLSMSAELSPEQLDNTVETVEAGVPPAEETKPEAKPEEAEKAAEVATPEVKDAEPLQVEVKFDSKFGEDIKSAVSEAFTGLDEKTLSALKEIESKFDSKLDAAIKAMEKLQTTVETVSKASTKSVIEMLPLLDEIENIKKEAHSNTVSNTKSSSLLELLALPSQE